MSEIGIINSPMFGTPSKPGEHVNWSEPDYWEVTDFESFMGESVAAFATENPHMIVWSVGWREPFDLTNATPVNDFPFPDYDAPADPTWHGRFGMYTLTCRNHPTAEYTTKNPFQRNVHCVQVPVGMTKECDCPFHDLVVVGAHQS